MSFFREGLRPYFRDLKKSIAVLGFWRTMYLRNLYRPIMRIIHQWGWHAMTRVYVGMEHEHEWCQWCGLRSMLVSQGGRVMTDNVKRPLQAGSVRQ
jgi:hypothetical protein